MMLECMYTHTQNNNKNKPVSQLSWSLENTKQNKKKKKKVGLKKKNKKQIKWDTISKSDIPTHLTVSQPHLFLVKFEDPVLVELLAINFRNFPNIFAFNDLLRWHIVLTKCHEITWKCQNIYKKKKKRYFLTSWNSNSIKISYLNKSVFNSTHTTFAWISHLKTIPIHSPIHMTAQLSERFWKNT